MSELKLNAELREGKGTGVSRKLRREELVPAQLYQREKENINLQVVAKELDKVITEAGTSTIITLVVNGEEKNVLIKDFQRHPFKNQYLHVDFLGVNMNETLRVSVPVVLLNRDEIRLQPSVLMQQLEEIEIETLPKNMPSEVILDVENMEYNDVFYVKDLSIVNDENITILTDLEEVVCTLLEPQEEVIEDDVEVSAADVEVIGKQKEE
ncbi:50S ribosomal protein L25 [Helcococcus ovis]|uniref:Large ribosomal subunit protein bL25 n=1 Tax=Helcococcus ovis TaxID=72026 RepID=A0A4R9C127_9FIRM|nr:50S ribosomal protein L25 [Helcococcus ovis]TFF65492.1 50S ribosomal protein L25 [Helcococcus ovis]TFF65730.1 50S ribosomal protein L25 [Helcococcus ovis]